MTHNLQNYNNVLYVSNFKRSTTQIELRKLFQVFGTINSVNIIPKSDIAYGFVQFDDIRDAIDAHKGLHKSFYRGRNLKVEYKNIKNNHNLNLQRHVDTGDQSKSKQQIFCQKLKQKERKCSNQNKIRNKRICKQYSRSRSRSRNKNHKYNSRSSSCSYSYSQQNQNSYSYINSSHQRQLKKERFSQNKFNQIDKLYQIIDDLEYRVKCLQQNIRHKFTNKQYHHTYR